MKLVLWMTAASVSALALSSCGNSGGGGGNSQGATGPYDRNGNYVEAWADDPSKWRKSGGSSSPHELKSDRLPEIAKNDEPPPNSNPLPPSAPSRSAPVISQTQVVKAKPTPVRSTEIVRAKPPAAKSEPAVVKAKPKPKPTVAKAKVKPKPTSTRYVVKKGDSLSAIASRTGSSVSAIKSANSISGTLIRPGQSLVIPKR